MLLAQFRKHGGPFGGVALIEHQELWNVAGADLDERVANDFEVII